MLITWFLSLNTLKLDLDSLESPARLLTLVSSSDIEDSKNARIGTGKFLVAYLSLAQKERQVLVTQWFKRRKSQMAEYAIRGMKHKVDYERRDFSDTMSACDLSKIDLLLLAQGDPPIFHLDSWLRKVYGVSSNGKFAISKNPSWPEQLVLFSSGPPEEPPAASFDPFFNDERPQASLWITSGLKQGSYRPMSEAMMRIKIQRWLNNGR